MIFIIIIIIITIIIIIRLVVPNFFISETEMFLICPFWFWDQAAG